MQNHNRKSHTSLTQLVAGDFVVDSSHILTNSFKVKLRGKCVRSWCDGSSDRPFIVNPLSYFSFQLVLHDWCNKGRGMCMWDDAYKKTIAANRKE